MEDPSRDCEEDERTPLLSPTSLQSPTSLERAKQTLEHTKESVVETATWWQQFFQTYEPIDEGVAAEHPSALMLLGAHLGMAFLQISSVIGAYAQLVANAELIFPECSKYSVVDYMFNLDTETGYLCEITSQTLWTFPLLCCLMIPFFEYWDFCHSRLYYECLRVRMLLILPDKDLLTSPVFYFVIALLSLGIATAAFTNAEPRNFFRAVMPVLLPVFTFISNMYINWDLKFYLITLPNLAKDVEWTKGFFKVCIEVTEGQLEQAYRRKEFLGWDGSTSHDVFLELRQEAMHVISKREDWAQEQRQTVAKAAALCCGGRGWWVSDLLFHPVDRRSSHFRFAFRVFSIVVTGLVAIILFMMVSTLLTYRVITGRMRYRDIGPFGFLRSFMIHRAGTTSTATSFISVVGNSTALTPWATSLSTSVARMAGNSTALAFF